MEKKKSGDNQSFLGGNYMKVSEVMSTEFETIEKFYPLHQ